MQKLLWFRRLLYGFTCGILVGLQLPSLALNSSDRKAEEEVIAQNNVKAQNFLVIGGGSSPCNNEIALEKNILYFQRTLRNLGYNPEDATIFFANGNNGQTTVRYLDEEELEQYKTPKIPSLDGAATLANLQSWMKQTTDQNTNN